MKRIILLLVLAAFLFAAWGTKPSDKECIEEAVAVVWGERAPDKYTYPQYYNQFMNMTSKDVEVSDWILLKRIRYRIEGKPRLIGYGLFKRVLVVS